MSKPHIAFIGMGTMGAGMANRLADAGYALTVFNRSPDRSKGLAGKGARVAASPRDAAGEADVIIAMLSDDAASRAVWLGDSGALAGAKNSAIALDSSTLTIAWARELAERAAKRGLRFLDAPVTGTKPNAEKGELVFLVGGDQAVFQEVRPALAPMCRDAVYLGPTGSGAAMKLINNFLAAVQAASFAEALAMITACHLDPGAAVPILLNGAPGSPVLKALHNRIASNDPTVYFQLGLMTKDVSYALQEAHAHGIDLPTAAAALERFQAAVAAGLSAGDFSAVLRPLPK